MAAKYALVPITIASPPDPDECTSTYFVEYKLTGDAGYTLLGGNGYTTDNPIRIEPLVAASTYDYRITRNCCNGQSNTTEGSFTTTA